MGALHVQWQTRVACCPEAWREGWLLASLQPHQKASLPPSPLAASFLEVARFLHSSLADGRAEPGWEPVCFVPRGAGNLAQRCWETCCLWG